MLPKVLLCLMLNSKRSKKLLILMACFFTLFKKIKILKSFILDEHLFESSKMLFTSPNELVETRKTIMLLQY